MFHQQVEWEWFDCLVFTDNKAFVHARLTVVHNLGPVIFRDRGKVAEFAELPTWNGIREIPIFFFFFFFFKC